MKTIVRLNNRRALILLMVSIVLIGIVWSGNELSSSNTAAKTIISSAKPEASPSENTVTTPNVSHRYTIVIDAGHGGKDPGAEGASGKREQAYTLALSEKVFDLLEQDPMFEVHMTRKDDSFIDLESRAQFANDLDADAFVSIHGNTFTDSEVSGTETYYYDEKSIPFANEVHEQLAKATGFRDRGVKQEGWKVLTHSQNLAILLEVGYLTNSSDESEMLSESHQNRTAQAIVQGIKNYFGD